VKIDTLAKIISHQSQAIQTSSFQLVGGISSNLDSFLGAGSIIHVLYQLINSIFLPFMQFVCHQ